MENTTTQKNLTAIKINHCRMILSKMAKSIQAGYITEEWKEDKVNNYENIVETYSGYYAFENDCISAENIFYLHEDLDDDEYIFDEIDACYILENNSVYVKDGRDHGYSTHYENADSSNGIYEYNGEYITESYMEWHEMVFDVHGRIGYIEDLYYWESDGEWHHSAEPEDDEDDEHGEIINSYSYKPSPKYYRLNNDNDKTPFFGIELEVERKNSNDLKHSEMAEMIEHDHWYFKSDGSLTDGFEIVTHPLTFNYIKHSAKSFEDSLRLLIDNNYNSYNANTCGMHVHITKKCFTTWHLYRFLKFFVENKEFIVAISQRKMEKLKKWANIEDDNESELIYKAKKKNGNSERYVAVNLRNNATIEIRIFRGTLNFNSFMKNIEFCHSVFMYTKENNEISLSGFKEYLNYSKDYSNLKKFITLKNL